MLDGGVVGVSRVDGHTKAVLKGPVWNSLTQSSPCAEFTALAALAQHARPGCSVFADYHGVIRAVHDAGRAMAWNKVHAGIFREAFFQERYRHIGDITWVKAHQGLASLQGRERYLALGNGLADAAAKEGAGMHLSWTEGERADAEDLFAHNFTFFSMVAQILAEALKRTPAQGGGVVQFQQKARRVRQKPRQVRGTISSHCFVRAVGGTGWRCLACLLHVRCTGSGRAGGTCPGHSDIIRSIIANHGGHLLWVGQVGDHGFIFVCSVCGAWATEKPQKLLHAYPGRAPAHGRRDAACIFRRGLLPDNRKAVVSGLSRITV